MNYGLGKWETLLLSDFSVDVRTFQHVWGTYFVKNTCFTKILSENRLKSYQKCLHSKDLKKSKVSLKNIQNFCLKVRRCCDQLKFYYATKLQKQERYINVFFIKLFRLFSHLTFVQSRSSVRSIEISNYLTFPIGMGNLFSRTKKRCENGQKKNTDEYQHVWNKRLPTYMKQQHAYTIHTCSM